MAKRTTGVVRWFDGSKGFGTIHAEDGEKVFVHLTAISRQAAPLLMEGEKAAFFHQNIVHGPQPSDVTRLN